MANKVNGVTFISAQTAIDGEISLENSALVAGQLKGKINSAGRVEIERNGLIEGELTCHELRVSGVFKGNLICNKLVIVSTGVVEGDVSSHQMEIYDGGQFIGQRSKGPTPESMPSEPTSKDEPVISRNANPLAPDSQPKRKVWLPLIAAAAGITAVIFYVNPAWLQNMADPNIWKEESVAQHEQIEVMPVVGKQVTTDLGRTENGRVQLATADSESLIRTTIHGIAAEDGLQYADGEEDLEAMEAAHAQLSAAGGVTPAVESSSEIQQSTEPTSTINAATDDVSAGHL